MPWPTKAKRKELRKELLRYGAKEIMHTAGYVGQEIGKLGVGLVDELGGLFTGTSSKPPKRR